MVAGLRNKLTNHFDKKCLENDFFVVKNIFCAFPDEMFLMRIEDKSQKRNLIEMISELSVSSFQN